MTKKRPRLPAEQPPARRPAAQRSPLHVVESLNSLSVDIARAIDHEASIELWDRYRRGERDVFTRRLYTLKGQQTFDEIRRKYQNDPDFRAAVDRYCDDFEKLLKDIARNDRDNIMTQTYLTSDTGKVYTMLAHARPVGCARGSATQAPREAGPIPPFSFRPTQRRFDRLAHRRVVAAMGSPGDLDPGLQIPDALDIDLVAGLACELAEVEHLRAPVAFAKRMHVVDVAHDLAGRPREGGGVERLQEVALHEAAVDVGHACLDIAQELELAAVLRDFDGAACCRPSPKMS